MPSASIRSVGIVGNGRMGEDIFYLLAEAAYSLRWVFRSQANRDAAAEKFGKKLRLLHRSGAIDDQDLARRKERALLTTRHEDLADCDLIIETVVEDAQVKAELFRKLDAIAKKDCVFVSNSSSIKPSRLWPESDRRERFAGFHLFFPVRYSPFAEIITTDRCSPETVASLREFAEKIGKSPLILPEPGAFILNKAFIYSQAAAFHARRENILSCREIDELVRKNIFTIGTFEFIDRVGIDVVLAASNQYREDLEHPDFITVTIEEMQQLVDQGRLGLKTGHGFYRYEKGIAVEEPVGLRNISPEDRLKYEESVVNKIECLYINLAYDFIGKGYCTEAALEAALAKYKGMEKGPLTMGSEIGFDKVLGMLVKFHQETGEAVYLPTPGLKRKVDGA